MILPEKKGRRTNYIANTSIDFFGSELVRVLMIVNPYFR
jgi:hypothetical protein